MEQSPSSDFTTRSASEISRLLWNPKFHYRIHKNTPDHSSRPPASYFPKIYIIIFSHLRLGLPSVLSFLEVLMGPDEVYLYLLKQGYSEIT
jgi:hypothetical protein